MSEENKVLTPEEEQKQIEFLRGQSESLKFMRQHPRFKSSKANAEKLSEYIKEKGLEWNVANLAEAFKATQDKLELNPEYTAAPPETKKEVEEQAIPEWGLLTKQIIKTMPLESYQRFYKDPEFRRQVENVSNGRDQFNG